MTNHLLAAIAALSLTACLDEGMPAPGGDTVEVDTSKADSGAQLQTQAAVPHADQLDICAQLPKDDSACAHACDDDFADYITEGTCATFACTLTNGDEYITGGCNL